MEIKTMLGFCCYCVLIVIFSYSLCCDYKADLIKSYDLRLDEIRQNYQDRLESYQLYDGVPKDVNWGINGLYWEDRDYYCVWVKDRNISEIEETDKHEYCHHLVQEDYNHFC